MAGLRSTGQLLGLCRASIAAGLMNCQSTILTIVLRPSLLWGIIRTLTGRPGALRVCERGAAGGPPPPRAARSTGGWPSALALLEPWLDSLAPVVEGPGAAHRPGGGARLGIGDQGRPPRRLVLPAPGPAGEQAPRGPRSAASNATSSPRPCAETVRPACKKAPSTGVPFGASGWARELVTLAGPIPRRQIAALRPCGDGRWLAHYQPGQVAVDHLPRRRERAEAPAPGRGQHRANRLLEAGHRLVGRRPPRRILPEAEANASGPPARATAWSRAQGRGPAASSLPRIPPARM